MPPKVIVYGATVRAACQALGRAGFRVVGIDSFGDADTLAACDHHDVESLNSDAGIASFWRTHQDATHILRVGETSRRRAIDRLLDARPISVRSLHQRNPSLSELQAFCQGLSIRVPQTGRVSADEKKADWSNSIRHGRWLVKPTGSGGGIGIHAATPKDIANDVAGHANEIQLQRRVGGRSFGITYFANADASVVRVAILRSLRTGRPPHRFAYAGSVIVADASPCREWFKANVDAVDQLASRFVKATRHIGVFNIDVMFLKSQAFALEINARATAATEVADLASGENLLAATIRADLGTGGPIAAAFKQSQNEKWAKRILYANTALVWDGTIAGEIKLRVTNDFANVRMADIPHEPSTFSVGDPVFSVIGPWHQLRHIHRIHPAFR